MSSDTTGCFSWLRRRKKSTTKPLSRKPLDQEYELKGAESQIVPSASKYAFEAGKQTVQVLQRFANLLPVPCANEALELSLLLMTTYEDVTDIEQQVRNLKNRVATLMLVMIDELNDKEPTDISPHVLGDVERLSGDLRAIQRDLDKIASQNRLLLIFFKNANKSTISECIVRLNSSLQNFQIGRTVHDGNVLFEIQSRLQTIFETTKKMANQVNDIHSWMKAKNAHSATGLSLMAMPPPLAHMFGRDNVTSEIVRIITTEARPRVVIHGAGGMGKTSVAVAVMENEAVKKRYDANNRFWVPCIGAKSLGTFLDILSKSLHITQDTGDPLRDLISTLEASKEPCLMLLDNFETAWSLAEDLTDGGRISIEGILDSLAAIPHVAILVTIRTNTFSSDTIDWTLFHLEGVVRDDARAIFTRINPATRDHPALNQLLEALGYMPYAVTLLAKQAAKSGLPPDVLLEEWQKRGLNSLSVELKRQMSTSITFSVESRSMSEDVNAQALLAILSRLPSGTNSKHLKWWASSVTNPYGAIATLSDTALITQYQDDGISTYFVLPVVQSYLNEHPHYNSPRILNLVLTACCRFILDHKSSPGDERFKEHQEALSTEQTNILSILLAVTTTSFSETAGKRYVSEAMLAFCWFQYWKKRSLELLRHLLGLLSHAGDPDSLRYTSEARFCLGKMYIKLGRYRDACTELEAARETFRGLGSPSDIIRAGECALEIADSWSFTLEPGDRIARLINEAQKELKEDPKVTARALMALGENECYIGRPSKAVEQLKIAEATLQKLDCKVEVADCLFIMSRCYAQQHSLPEWLSTAQDCLAASRLVGMNDLIAKSLRSLSRCHIVHEQYDEALCTLREAFGISEQLGHPLAIAQVLELSGYSYAKMQDLAGARLAYEEAKKVYANMETTWQTKTAKDTCERNIGKILQCDSSNDAFELEPPMLY